MKALVIYDSFFGNTEQIAYSIRDSLGSNVEALRVGDVEPEQISGLEYLIVGSPIRAFKPTKAITTFLKKMPGGSLRGVNVAAFDTRMDKEEVDSSVLKVFVRFFGALEVNRLITNEEYSALTDLLKKRNDLLHEGEGIHKNDASRCFSFAHNSILQRTKALEGFSEDALSKFVIKKYDPIDIRY
jgi:flavodoxin